MLTCANISIDGKDAASESQTNAQGQLEGDLVSKSSAEVGGFLFNIQPRDKQTSVWIICGVCGIQMKRLTRLSGQSLQKCHSRSFSLPKMSRLAWVCDGRQGRRKVSPAICS